MNTSQAFFDLFVGRVSDFARQRSDGGYLRVGRALTLDDIRAHLDGKITLGSYVRNEQGQCSFAVFDADGDDGLQVLRDLQRHLAGQHIPSYLERSRRGGHLWVFLTAPMLASQVRAWLVPLCPAGVEFYPKQGEGAGYGSLIRLPLGVHLRSGKRYPFVQWSERSPVPVARSLEAHLDWLTTIERVEVPARENPTPRAPTPQKTSFSTHATGSPLFHTQTIQQWCATQDPFEVIGRYVDLTIQGAGQCPFGGHHASGRDTRASFVVYHGTPGGFCWYCHAWQQGGSVFDFLRYWYHLSPRQMWNLIQTEQREKARC